MTDSERGLALNPHKPTPHERVHLHALVERGSRDGAEVGAEGFGAGGIALYRFRANTYCIGRFALKGLWSSGGLLDILSINCLKRLPHLLTPREVLCLLH